MRRIRLLVRATLGALSLSLRSFTTLSLSALSLSALSLSALSLSGALLLGCQPPVALDLVLEGEALVEAGGPLDQLVGRFPPFDGLASFDIESAAELMEQGLSRESVREAELVLARVDVVDPESATLDFLNEIHFFVEAPSVERARVAGASPGRDLRGVELDLDRVDLAPFLREEGFTIVTTANGKNPESDVLVRAELMLHVVAQP